MEPMTPLARLYRGGRLLAEVTGSDEIRGHRVDDIAWLREPTTEEYCVALAAMGGEAPREGMHMFSQLKHRGELCPAKARTILGFEEWYNEFGDEASIKAAELGCDREHSFDIEAFAEDKYYTYLTRMHNSVVRPSSSVLFTWLDLWVSRRRTWERYAWQLLFTPGPWYVASACPVRDMQQVAYKAIHRAGVVPSMLFSHDSAAGALKQAVKFARAANWSKAAGASFTQRGAVNTYHLFGDGTEAWHPASNTCMCEINNILERAL